MIEAEKQKIKKEYERKEASVEVQKKMCASQYYLRQKPLFLSFSYSFLSLQMKTCFKPLQGKSASFSVLGSCYICIVCVCF